MGEAKDRQGGIKKVVAGATALVFLFSSVAAPLAEANLWKERRKARGEIRGSGALSSGTSSPPAQAPLPRDFAAAVSAFPVEKALFSAVSPASAVPAPRSGAGLPAWLFTLPSEYGDVQQVSPASPGRGGPAVVILQDVHNVPSAQRNISHILSHLQTGVAREQKARLLVGLEGAAGPFELERRRRGDPKHRAFIAGYFLERKFIGGPEYFGLLAPEEPLFWGVEDPALYMDNVRAYRQAAARGKELDLRLAALEKSLEPVRERVLGPELRDLDRRLTQYQEGRLSPLAFISSFAGQVPSGPGFAQVRRFLEVLDVERSLDFSRVETERRRLVQALSENLDPSSQRSLLERGVAYRLGRVSYGDFHGYLSALARSCGVPLERFPAFDRYVRYVLLSEKIDRHRLFEEVESLKEEAVRRLARTPSEKRAMEVCGDLRLLRRLRNHEFGPGEWAKYAEQRERIAALPERVRGLAEGAGVAAPPPAEDWGPLLAPFENFYRAAEDRNQAMVENLLKRFQVLGSRFDTKDGEAETGIRNSEPPVVALVAGGYHTPGLQRILREKGLSVLTFSPKFEAAPEGTKYLDVFTAGRIPLERMLLGERLNLAYWRNFQAGGAPDPGIATGDASLDLILERVSAALAEAEAAGQVVEVPIPESQVACLAALDGQKAALESRLQGWRYEGVQDSHGDGRYVMVFVRLRGATLGERFLDRLKAFARWLGRGQFMVVGLAGFASEGGGSPLGLLAVLAAFGSFLTILAVPQVRKWVSKSDSLGAIIGIYALFFILYLALLLGISALLGVPVFSALSQAAAAPVTDNGSPFWLFLGLSAAASFVTILAAPPVRTLMEKVDSIGGRVLLFLLIMAPYLLLFTWVASSLGVEVFSLPPEALAPAPAAEPAGVFPLLFFASAVGSFTTIAALPPLRDFVKKLDSVGGTVAVFLALLVVYLGLGAWICASLGIPLFSAAQQVGAFLPYVFILGMSLWAGGGRQWPWGPEKEEPSRPSGRKPLHVAPPPVEDALETVLDATDDLFGGEGAVGALQYGLSQGNPDLMNLLSLYLAREGTRVHPGTEMVVLDSLNEAVDSAARLLANPGDRVLALGGLDRASLQPFERYGASLAEAPGLAALEKSLPRYRWMSRLKQRLGWPRVKCVALPLEDEDGRPLLTEAEQERLLKLARDHDFFILEMGDFQPSAKGRTRSCLKEKDSSGNDGHVIQVRDFSGFLGPGLSVALVAGPPELMSKMEAVKGVTTLHASSFAQALLIRALRDRHPLAEEERAALSAPLSEPPAVAGPSWMARSRVFSGQGGRYVLGPIREMLKRLKQRPNAVKLGAGAPDPRTFPVGEIPRMLKEFDRNDWREALGASPAAGLPRLRKILAERVAAQMGGTLSLAEENVLVTDGSQQALDIMGYQARGRSILAQRPSYVGQIGATKPFGVPTLFRDLNDESEANRRAIEEEFVKLVEQARRTGDYGRVPALIYVQERFANPTGDTMSQAQREWLVGLRDRLNALLPADQAPIILVVDDPYGELNFQEAGRAGDKSILEIAGGKGVVLLQTFSKIFVPGTRVGWTVGDAEIVAQWAAAKESVSAGSSGFGQVLAYKFIASGSVDRHIREVLIPFYRQKKEEMVRALREHLPEARFTDPQGGLFIAAYLPEGVDGKKLADELIDNGVEVDGERVYVTVTPLAYFVDGEPGAERHGIRLCYSTVDIQDIEKGIRAIAIKAREMAGTSGAARATEEKEAAASPVLLPRSEKPVFVQASAQWPSERLEAVLRVHQEAWEGNPVAGLFPDIESLRAFLVQDPLGVTVAEQGGRIVGVLLSARARTGGDPERVGDWTWDQVTDPAPKGDAPDTRVFYAVGVPRDGLTRDINDRLKARGERSLGAQLIREARTFMAREEGTDHFFTLSPTNFGQVRDPAYLTALEAFKAENGIERDDDERLIRFHLNYVDAEGRHVDPTAGFHLGNGAEVGAVIMGPARPDSPVAGVVYVYPRRAAAEAAAAKSVATARAAALGRAAVSTAAGLAAAALLVAGLGALFWPLILVGGGAGLLAGRRWSRFHREEAQVLEAAVQNTAGQEPGPLPRAWRARTVEVVDRHGRPHAVALTPASLPAGTAARAVGTEEIQMDPSLLGLLDADRQELIFDHELRHIRFRLNHPWLARGPWWVEELLVAWRDEARWREIQRRRAVSVGGLAYPLIPEARKWWEEALGDEAAARWRAAFGDSLMLGHLGQASVRDPFLALARAEDGALPARLYDAVAEQGRRLSDMDPDQAQQAFGTWVFLPLALGLEKNLTTDAKARQAYDALLRETEAAARAAFPDRPAVVQSLRALAAAGETARPVDSRVLPDAGVALFVGVGEQASQDDRFWQDVLANAEAYFERPAAERRGLAVVMDQAAFDDPVSPALRRLIALISQNRDPSARIFTENGPVTGDLSTGRQTLWDPAAEGLLSLRLAPLLRDLGLGQAGRITAQTHHASPVDFDLAGLDRALVVERIIWLIQGVAIAPQLEGLDNMLKALQEIAKSA